MFEDGVWRTIGKRRVFIKNGQSLSDAMKESKKFVKDKYKNGTFKDKERKGVFKDGKYVWEKTNSSYITKDGTEIKMLEKDDYNKAAKEFNEKIDDNERKIINKYLDAPGLAYEQKGGKELLDNIIEKKGYELKEDTLLFRRAYEKGKEVEKGFKKDDFVSTSAYETIPKTMPSGKKFGETDMYIIAPKGTKVMPIEKVAMDYVSASEKNIFSKQHEIVLPRGMQFEMVKDLSGRKISRKTLLYEDFFKYVVKANKKGK